MKCRDYYRIEFKIGCLNVCGYDEKKKRKDIIELMNKRKLHILVICETKVDTQRAECFGGCLGCNWDVHDWTKAKHEVDILVKSELLSCVVQKKELSPRHIWVKLKFGEEEWVIIGAYGVENDQMKSVKDAFWDKLTECLEGFRPNDKILVVGNLNAKVGVVPIEGVMG